MGLPAVVMAGNDVFMPHLHQRLGLARKAIDVRRIGCERRVDDLDRNVPIKLNLTASVNRTHSAAAEQAIELQMVITETDQRVCGHGVSVPVLRSDATLDVCCDYQ